MKHANMIGGALLAILLGTGIVILWITLRKKNGKRSNKEKYGGPVKVVASPPISTCNKRCGSYTNWCLKNYGHIDAGRCYRDHKACLSTCKYGYRK